MSNEQELEKQLTIDTTRAMYTVLSNNLRDWELQGAAIHALLLAWIKTLPIEADAHARALIVQTLLMDSMSYIESRKVLGIPLESGEAI